MTEETEADIQVSIYLLLTGTELCDVGVVAVPLWPGQRIVKVFGCKFAKLRVGGLAWVAELSKNKAHLLSENIIFTSSGFTKHIVTVFLG